MAAQLKKGHRPAWLLSTLALSVLATAGLPGGVSYAETRPQYGGVVVSSLLEEPVGIDPTRAKTHTDIKIAALVFDSLYRMEDGAALPHLASALPDHENPLEVRIALRKGVLFHNGHTMQPADVVASLERLRKSTAKHLVSNIKSLRAEEGALVVELHRPDATLAISLSSVHTSVTLKGREPSWRRLVGTGPFRLKERSTRKRELRLVAHQRYFAGRAYADEIKLRWFEQKSAEARSYETGASHISMRGQIAFAGHRPKYQTRKRSVDATILVYLGFGKSSNLVGEPSFRLALASALGRSGMKQIGSGEPVVPTLSPLPRSVRGTVISSAGLTANTGKSRALLKELALKYSTLESGTVLLDILVNASRPDDTIVAGRIAAALFAVGIQTRLVSVQPNVFARRIALGQCDLYIGQLATAAQRPEDTLRSAFVAGGFAKLLPALAKKNRASMERQFAKQLPVVPLFHRGLRVHNRSDLLGIEFDSRARLGYEDIYFFGSPEKN